MRTGADESGKFRMGNYCNLNGSVSGNDEHTIVR